eukprot:Gb_32817 [translate_table: standard]
MHVNTLEGRVGSGSSSSASATQLISPSPGAALFQKSFNDPKIAEYDALVQTSFGRVLAAAEKIGDQVLLATKGALASEKDILLKINPTLKTIAECLPALTWVVYTRKECGLSLPAVHVEESGPERLCEKVLSCGTDLESHWSGCYIINLRAGGAEKTGITVRTSNCWSSL